MDFALEVKEHSPFLDLFPHRWDYIYAPLPQPDQSPQWQTETKHPLSDRLIISGRYLWGVRFGAETKYFLLDIDKSSPYHPKRDRFAIRRILQALETIGVTSSIRVTSSHSGGIHIYCPLAQSVSSWKIAAVVKQLLETSGFYIGDGILEVFPNHRNYEPGKPQLFKAHRLPLQSGSYLLDDDFQLVWSDPEKFYGQWCWCEYRNHIDTEQFDRLLSIASRRYCNLSQKAEKFLNDLDSEIELGWTQGGQTNRLLGRITLREYIFGGWIQNAEPLTGDRLIQQIVATAVQLPGYTTYCRHQHEIWDRAEDWARSAENSHYWPYKVGKASQVATEQPAIEVIKWNQFQRERARDKITFAIADLLNKGELPVGARARFQVLTNCYELGGETLYIHRDLWHPDHLWKTPPAPPPTKGMSLPISSKEEEIGKSHPTLLESMGGNANHSEGLRRFLSALEDLTGGNTAQGEGYSDFWRDPGG